MLKMDHLVYCAATLGEGAAALTDALGVAPGVGGEHSLMSTHNWLLGLGAETYFEVIAPDPDVPPPGHRRWFDLDNFSGAPRLTHWVLRSDDLGASLAAAPEGAGRITALSRGDLQWRMAIPESGRLPFDDAFPGLIEWQGRAHPCQRLVESGCRLLGLEVAHPEAVALRAAVPLVDPRVTFVTGKRALRATFETPAGRRVLE